jgi:hypothetical protein
MIPKKDSPRRKIEKNKRPILKKTLGADCHEGIGTEFFVVLRGLRAFAVNSVHV